MVGALNLTSVARKMFGNIQIAFGVLHKTARVAAIRWHVPALTDRATLPWHCNPVGFWLFWAA